MKLNVPFFKQTSSLNCGPTCLKMVFAYFGNDIPIEKVEEITDIKDGKGINFMQKKQTCLQHYPLRQLSILSQAIQYVLQKQCP